MGLSKLSLLLPILILTCLNGYSQPFKRSINKYSETGQRQGLWISYWDEENKIPMSKARYEDGRVKGVNKGYYQNGNIQVKKRYLKNRIRVKYYYENRKLEQKGWAVLEYNPEDIHYYWHGCWKFYDTNRKLVSKACYENGVEILSEFF
ncbi:MAG: hypothetical protein JW731_09655 [Bacteroidales bacterium]|nr:hypothetical protein [Bacteroidales bacterium]